MFSSAAGGGAENFLVTIFPFALVFVIIYFMIIRPQQRRVKDHQNMVNNVRRGDVVVTSGGIIGKVVKVGDDNEIQVEIAEGVKVRVIKSTLTDVRTKGDPAPATTNATDK